MKKVSILILIAAFLFPTLGHAAPVTTKSTPQVDAIDITSPSLQGKTLAAKKAAVQSALSDIYTQLTKLSAQTQDAATQLASNGIATTEAQASLLQANASLAKAKTSIATFNTTRLNLEALKVSAAAATSDLSDAKGQLLEALTALKASVANI